MGSQTVRTYDADRRVKTQRDANGNTTSYAFDLDGELVIETRPDQSTIVYGFDADGNRTSVQDGAAHVTSYHFDDPALPQSVTSSSDPLNNTTTVAYDRAGNPLTRQLPSGNCATTPKAACVTYAYDSANHLTAVTYSDGTTPNVTGLHYDGDGRRTSMTDGTGTSSWTWDSLGRMTRSTNGTGGVVQYGYDLAGRVTTMTYPNGQSVSRAYDAAGRWQTASDFKNNVTTFGYDADSNVIATTFPGAAGADLAQFDANDRMTGATFASGSPSSTYAGLAYARDGEGALVGESQFGLALANRAYNYTTLGQLAAGNRVGVIDAAINTSAVVKNNGSTWDWGDNTTGEAGNGTAGGSVTAPLPLGSPLNAGVTTIASGQLESFNVALRNDGSVWGWGDNSKGELGDGTTTQRNSPVQVTGMSSAVAVAGGGWHTMALRADGTVWDWGGNAYGQLGNNATANSSAPVQAAGPVGVGTIAAGEFHSVAIDQSGRVWAWGRNSSGQLGDGTTTDRHVPVQVAGIANVVGIAAGNAHTLAVRGDGTVWAWGTNSGGQLGITSCTNVSPCLTPTQVPGLSNIVSVGVGSFSSYAVDRTGKLYAWGSNGYGQLGDGTTTQRNTPVLISGLSGVSAVSGGLHHTLASTTAGGVYAWGDNSSGQLGNVSCTTTAPCLTPTLVTGMNATGVANYPVTYDGGDNVAQFPRGADQGFDAADRLCWSSTSPSTGTCAAPPSGATTYQYNARGDQTGVTPPTGAAKSYGYDLADDMTSYASGTTSWAYSYDGDGLRTAKTPSGGAATVFTYDLAEGMPLIISDGSSYYITGPGGLPLEQTDLSGNPTAYFHHDQLGTTRALTSPSGTASTFTYNPWGQLGNSSGTLTTAFGWAGQYADAETGLVWMRARSYSPATAQFQTRDPIVGLTGEPYSYGSDDPLNQGDPTGLWSWRKALGVVGAVAGAVALGAVIVVASPVEIPAAMTVGLVAGAVAVGASFGVTAIDCRKAVDANCMIDAAGTVFGLASLGLGSAGALASAGRWGEAGEFFKDGFDIYGGASGAVSGLAGFLGLHDPHANRPSNCPTPNPPPPPSGAINGTGTPGAPGGFYNPGAPS
jgi:RHS repeat-associated protein